jgi:hypothetical protein
MATKTKRKRQRKEVFFGLLVVDRKITKNGAEVVRIWIKLDPEIAEPQLYDEALERIFGKRAPNCQDWTDVMDSIESGKAYHHPTEPFEAEHCRRRFRVLNTLALPVFLSNQNLLMKVRVRLSGLNIDRPENRKCRVQAFCKSFASLVTLCSREHDLFDPDFIDSINEVVAKVAEITLRISPVIPFGKSEIDMLKPEKPRK